MHCHAYEHEEALWLLLSWNMVCSVEEKRFTFSCLSFTLVFHSFIFFIQATSPAGILAVYRTPGMVDGMKVIVYASRLRRHAKTEDERRRRYERRYLFH